MIAALVIGCTVVATGLVTLAHAVYETRRTTALTLERIEILAERNHQTMLRVEKDLTLFIRQRTTTPDPDR